MLHQRGLLWRQDVRCRFQIFVSKRTFSLGPFLETRCWFQCSLHRHVFLNVEDGRHGHNCPKVQLLSVDMMVFDPDSSSCGWVVAPTGCSRFKLSSISIGAPCDYTPRLGGKFLFLTSHGNFSFDSSSSFKYNTRKLGSTKNHFQNIMSRICVPLNFASLVVPYLWGPPKFHNML